MKEDQFVLEMRKQWEQLNDQQKMGCLLEIQQQMLFNIACNKKKTEKFQKAILSGRKESNQACQQIRKEINRVVEEDKKIEELTKQLKGEWERRECMEQKAQKDNETFEQYYHNIMRELQEQESINKVLDQQIEKENNKTEQIEKSFASLDLGIGLTQRSLAEMDERMKKIDFEDLYIKEQRDELFLLKKNLNNELQDLRGNIRVYCRIRPFLPHQEKYPISQVSSNTALELKTPEQYIKSANNTARHNFYFDQIFDMGQTQIDVFNELSQLIESAIDGKNVCIFAYGQTGSGKTFTMEGQLNEQNEGIIPRSVDLIFNQIQLNMDFNWKYTIEVSVVQIYLDNVRDLLDQDNTSQNVTTLEVKTKQDVFAMLNKAHDTRKVAETKANERSSRSHLIFMLQLKATNPNFPGSLRKGCLNLVDLAGSQRVDKSEVSGERLKQTIAINSSLTSLGIVISKLSAKGKEGKEGHVPFRNCKLTVFLESFLIGDSKTLMLVNISPTAADFNQTLNSLRFAQSVRECKLKK